MGRRVSRNGAFIHGAFIHAVAADRHPLTFLVKAGESERDWSEDWTLGVFPDGWKDGQIGEILDRGVLVL